MKEKLDVISAIVIAVAAITYGLVNNIYESVYNKEMNFFLFMIVTVTIGFFIASYVVSKKKRLHVEEICRDYIQYFNFYGCPNVEEAIMKPLRSRLNNNKKYVNSYTKEKEFDECALRQLLFVCNLLLSAPQRDIESFEQAIAQESITLALFNIGICVTKTAFEKGYIDKESGAAVTDELSRMFESKTILT